MKQFKIKSLEEVNKQSDKTLSEIKRDFKIQSVLIALLIILGLIICFKSWDLVIDYEALKQEKQALEDLTETQSSMISDLEENCKDLFIQVEELKEEYVYGFGGSK